MVGKSAGRRRRKTDPSGTLISHRGSFVLKLPKVGTTLIWSPRCEADAIYLRGPSPRLQSCTFADILRCEAFWRDWG